jgi:hypothetical protein
LIDCIACPDSGVGDYDIQSTEFFERAVEEHPHVFEARNVGLNRDGARASCTRLLCYRMSFSLVTEVIQNQRRPQIGKPDGGRCAYAARRAGYQRNFIRQIKHGFLPFDSTQNAK